MEKSSKNLIAAAYLSGVGEAFKKAKSVQNGDLEKYIEDAKVLRRQLISRSIGDGYENPTQLIEAAKQYATNNLTETINIKTVFNNASRKNLNTAVTPSIVSNTGISQVIEPVTASDVNPVFTPPTSFTETPKVNNAVVLTPPTNITPPTNVTPPTNISPSPSPEPSPSPSPEPAQATSFLSMFQLGGRRGRRKTKKSNRRRKARKNTRK